MSSPLDQAPVIVAPRSSRRRAQSALADTPGGPESPLELAAKRIVQRTPVSAKWLAQQFGRPGLTDHQRRLLGGEKMRRRAYAALDRYRVGLPMDGRWSA